MWLGFTCVRSSVCPNSLPLYINYIKLAKSSGTADFIGCRASASCLCHGGRHACSRGHACYSWLGHLHPNTIAAAAVASATTIVAAAASAAAATSSATTTTNAAATATTTAASACTAARARAFVRARHALAPLVPAARAAVPGHRLLARRCPLAMAAWAATLRRWSAASAGEGVSSTAP